MDRSRYAFSFNEHFDFEQKGHHFYNEDFFM